MKRIIYGVPSSNTPSGGVKVIYRQSEMLNKIGFNSAIWHPDDNQFKCDWFSNSAKTIQTSELSPGNDFIIIPEIWASYFTDKLKDMGFQVGIYVQNCYYTHFNLNSKNVNAIKESYRDADIILSISQDTSKFLKDVFNVPPHKIVLQRYSVDHNLFRPNKKSKLITYMPRKMEQHSNRVISALKNIIPKEWEIRPLNNMSEFEIAQNLSESIIFLAFSEFEGLPVPPVEASLCGNIVIGYHGQGGQEYWFKPNFVEIEQGNILDFTKKTLETIKLIESNNFDIDSMNQTIKLIGEYFSKNNENEMLYRLVSKINDIQI